MNKLRIIIPAVFFVACVAFFICEYTGNNVEFVPVKINVIVEDNLNISLQEANMLKEDGFWNKHPTSIPVRDYSQVQFEDKNYGNSFRAFFCMDVYNKKVKYNNCTVNCTMNIDESYWQQLFWYDSNETTPFNAPECTVHYGQFEPYITGAMLPGSEEELKAKLKSVVITIYVKHQNGKITKTEVSGEDFEIEFEHRNVESGISYFENYKSNTIGE